MDELEGLDSANAAVDELYETAEKIVASQGSTGVNWEDLAMTMAVAFHNLNKHMSNDGAMPDEWV
jgi:hypothetical protein